jgi:glycosyltransferase involved in cell wall biosynthesis
VEILADSNAEPDESESCRVPVHADIDRWGFFGIRKLARRIESLEPDILHIHYPSKAYGSGLAIPFLPGLIHARRRHFKIVLTLHEFKLSHQLRRLASFILLDACDAVVMPCPLELEALIQRHRSVEEKIVAAIPVGPVGPSPDDFTETKRKAMRIRTREKLGIGEDEVVLLHYGTPTPYKGHEVLFKALHILKEEGETPLLLIAGDFRPDEVDLHRTLRGQAGGLGIRDQVRWLGRLPMDELIGIFVASDIAVFPFLDGFSFRRSSLVSVLNWNLPIITTEPDGDLPEVEDQEKVKFIARNDPKALATALLPLVTNPRALELARNAPNRLMEYFRWTKIASQYIDIYRQVIQKR